MRHGWSHDWVVQEVGIAFKDLPMFWKGLWILTHISSVWVYTALYNVSIDSHLQKEITDPFLAWWSSPKRSKAALSIPKCAKPCGNTREKTLLNLWENGGSTCLDSECPCKHTRLISDSPWLWSINSCSQCIASIPLLRLLGSSTGHHSIVKLVSCLE